MFGSATIGKARVGANIGNAAGARQGMSPGREEERIDDQVHAVVGNYLAKRNLLLMQIQSEL
jgi:hypothetical protein